MKQTELKITPPEGYEIDTDNSTLECIKFKEKTIHRRDDEASVVEGCCVNGLSSIDVIRLQNDWFYEL